MNLLRIAVAALDKLGAPLNHTTFGSHFPLEIAWEGHRSWEDRSWEDRSGDKAGWAPWRLYVDVTIPNLAVVTL